MRLIRKAGTEAYGVLPRLKGPCTFRTPHEGQTRRARSADANTGQEGTENAPWIAKEFATAPSNPRGKSS